MKKILLTVCLVLTSFALFAAPIGEQRAQEIATSFFARNATRATTLDLELEWSGVSFSDNMTLSAADNGDQALIYIYNRTDTLGFVIVAGDDSIEPIIAYSYNNTFDSDNMAEATRTILTAWCEQVAAARAGKIVSTRAGDTLSTGDVICQYTTALWDQFAPYNNLAPVIDSERCCTGCVATSMAILCYYHKWPERGVGTIPSYSYNYITIPQNVLGHKYNYLNMLFDYSAGYSAAQGNEVASLMYDMGTAVEMQYGVSASSAYTSDIPLAMSTYFGYNKGSYELPRANKSTSEWANMLKSHLKTNGPTIFRGTGEVGGHAFIIDGCTTKDYFSVNYGWSGYNNGYYLIPEIEFYHLQTYISDLVPDKTGSSTYTDRVSLYTHSSLYNGIHSNAMEYNENENITLYVGGVMNSGVVKYNGNVYIMVCDKNGNVKHQLYERTLSLSPRYYNYFSMSVTLPNEIVEGDRLRVYYIGTYSPELQWARSYDTEACDEIIICASPEDIAKHLTLTYTKSTKTLSFNASPLALQYRLTDSSGAVFTVGKASSDTTCQIDLSSCEKGEYTLSIASGGEPYTVTIVL